MPVANLKDVDLFYEIGGQGPLLVLVTGLAGVASYWQPNIEALERRFTVLRYDQRGTGRSTRTEGDYSVELLADDLVALLRSLALPPAILIGHSTGGAIGQVVAARRPDLVRRLVLYGSWAELCPQMRMCMELRQTLLLQAGSEAYHRASPLFLYPPPYVCEHSARIERDLAANIAASTTVTILAARIGAVLRFDGTPYLSAIRAPTLVVVARDDILTPPLASRRLAADIAGARYLELPYGGHAASFSVPEDFGDALLPFLDEATAETLAG